jgi:hypothetical protein
LNPSNNSTVLSGLLTTLRHFVALDWPRIIDCFGMGNSCAGSREYYCPFPGYSSSTKAKVYGSFTNKPSGSCQSHICVSNSDDDEIRAAGGVLYHSLNEYGYSLEAALLLAYLSRFVYFSDDVWFSEQPRSENIRDPSKLSPACRYWLGLLDCPPAAPCDPDIFPEKGTLNIPRLKALSSEYDCSLDSDRSLCSGLFFCESMGASGLILTREPTVDNGTDGRLFVIFRGTACSSSTLSDWDFFVQAPYSVPLMLQRRLDIDGEPSVHRGFWTTYVEVAAAAEAHRGHTGNTQGTHWIHRTHTRSCSRCCSLSYRGCWTAANTPGEAAERVAGLLCSPGSCTRPRYPSVPR